MRCGIAVYYDALESMKLSRNHDKYPQLPYIIHQLFLSAFSLYRVLFISMYFGFLGLSICQRLLIA